MEHYNSRKVAESYHRAFTKDVDNPKMKRKTIQRFTKFTSRLRHGGHILNAGCGTGRFVPYFIENGFKVTGIDSSSSMIELAANNNPEAEFRVMDICRLDFPSNSFDGIWNIATRTKDKTVTSMEGGEMMVNYYSPTKIQELLTTSGFEVLETSV